MFKYAKITLLILAAFLVLGFSITVNAAKPPSEQIINSGPIYGYSTNCMASNTTDRPIEIAVDTTYALIQGSGVYKHNQTTWTLTANGGMHLNIAFDVSGQIIAHCNIRWIGHPGEVRATMCGYGDPDVGFAPLRGCSDLY